MSIIQTENLCYTYDDGTRALNNISIKIGRGKTTAILGGNGAGKSTLFLNLNGILTPTSGSVSFNNEIVKYDRKSINELRKKVGIVFQDPDDQLFSASVYQDISFGAVNLKLPKDEVIKRVELAMEQTGITSLKDKPTHALSFGQKKRVAIAGVLVMQPDVIILDEPTAGLDPMGVNDIMKLLEEIRKKLGTAIVLATHDIDIVPLYADNVYVISNGNIILEGTPREVFSHPQVLRENNLRLPRIAHLTEILSKEDGFDIDASASTISDARKTLNDYIRKLKN